MQTPYKKMLCGAKKLSAPKCGTARRPKRAVDEQPQRTHRRCGRGGGGAGRAGRRTYAGPWAARRAAECCAMVMAVSQNQIAIYKNVADVAETIINLMQEAAERGHLAAAAGHAQACPRARELSRGRSRAPVMRSRRSRHAHALGGRGCGGRDPKG